MNALSRQKGITFSGFIMIAFLFVIVAIFTLKMIPVYMDNAKVQKAFDAMVRDTTLQNASTEDIKSAYYTRASVDGIESVNWQSIEVYKENGQLYLSAKYAVRIPLVANVTLLMEFNPHAPKN